MIGSLRACPAPCARVLTQSVRSASQIDNARVEASVDAASYPDCAVETISTTLESVTRSVLARSAWLLVLIGVLTVTSCDGDLFGGPTIPRDSSEVQIDLPADGQQTIAFEVESEVFPGSQYQAESVYITIHPDPESLLHKGIRTEHFWVGNRLEDTGFDNEILSIGEVVAGKPLRDLLVVTLSNDTDTPFKTTLTLSISPNGGVSVASEDDMRVSIDQVAPPPSP